MRRSSQPDADTQAWFVSDPLNPPPSRAAAAAVATAIDIDIDGTKKTTKRSFVDAKKPYALPAPMEKELFDLHINAGQKAGRDRTCGKKIAYASEEPALRAADDMNSKPTTRKPLEGYPCAFCEKWHVGRKMSIEELRSYITADDSDDKK